MEDLIGKKDIDSADEKPRESRNIIESVLVYASLSIIFYVENSIGTLI